MGFKEFYSDWKGVFFDIFDLMKSVFRWKTDLLDRAVGSAMILLLILIIGLTSLLSYVLINQVASTQGGVANKALVLKDSNPGYLLSTSTGMVPIVTYMPPSYLLCFDFDGKLVCGNFNKEYWDQAVINKKFAVAYNYGYLDGNYLITSVQALE